ncbi:VOC family protein [Fibrella sp. HMF5335]|uniref:VOC family protein n=1 Tax=Fibrella rubiginis TaxID=2817060 RepID=A0A939GGZ7_9BACT|nr:VOC family protein [Fibrella rubiginis]MBO0937280.1 VOC family protein [Fibrella rubiginis]
MESVAVSLDKFALHVNDVEQSMAYYQRIPGAKLIMHQPGHIAILQLGKNELNLVRLDIMPPFHLEFEVDEVDQLYADFQAQSFPTDGPPEDKPWGERTFYSKDPDGYLMEFSRSRH